MLSTVSPQRCDGMLRRLNAESDTAHKFAPADMNARIAALRGRPYVFGGTGFGSDTESLCALIPNQPEDHPLVISLVYGRDDKVNTDSLLISLEQAMRACLPDPETFNVEALQKTAA